MQEYWAEGVQAWFDASARVDVNDGVNTRARLRAHDPALATLLAATFGDGAWRFTHTLPTGARAAWLRRQAVCALATALFTRMPQRASLLLESALSL